MHEPDPTRLSAFESRWLAEALRLREERGGPLDDRDAIAAARAVAGDVEARIVERARWLGQREGLVYALASWRARMRLATMLVGAVALASGFGAALAVLGDGARPVNVVWTLGGLLGVHVASLALWIAGFWFGGRDAGGMLGHGWLWLSSRVSPGRERIEVGDALAGLLGRARLARWWLGAATHGVWAAALVGATVGLVATLATRRYGFVWETTILPADVFVRFVELVGRLPAALGFAVPDADIVRASGDAPASAEAARVAWSSWLVGCVVVYGVVPRVVLWALCFAVARTRRARLRLDLGLPGYAMLVPRLAPASERIGVTDADPGPFGGARAAGRHAVAGARAVLVGLELGMAVEWPPALPPGVGDAGVLDSRDDRRRVLAEFAAEPPARLVVGCDATQSPDRGSLDLIARLSRDAGDSRALLVGPDAGRGAERRGHWRDALAAIGLGPERVFDDERAALAWLAHGDAEDA